MIEVEKVEPISLMFDENGYAKIYDDTFDITIHCESEEEQNKVLEILNRRWIPVSEKLPEKDGYYLTTFVSFGSILLVDVISFAKNLKNVDHYDFDKAEPGWYNYDSEYGYYKVNSVIAWMPLPERYKEGE